MAIMNETLFTLINAPLDASPTMVAFAIFIAERLLLVVALVMVVAWVRGDKHTRHAFFVAGLTVILALVLNRLIGLIYVHDRPFAIGLGQQYLDHAPDSSFPSDHAALMFGVAFGLLWSGFVRWGFGALLAAIAVAWSRVYLGVHWPFDMLGAIGVAMVAGWIITRPLKPAQDSAFELAHRIYLGLITALRLPKSLFPR